MAAVLAAVTVLVGGCDDSEAPLQTAESEPDYLVYFSHDADSFHYYIPIYSTRELEVVDTISLHSESAYHDMRFTSDGVYAAYVTTRLVLEPNPLFERIMWVEQYDCKDTVAAVNQIGIVSLQLSPDNQYLLATGGGSGLNVYSMPDLTLLWSDATDFKDVAFLASSHEITYCVPGSDTFYVVDFASAADSVTKIHAPSGITGGYYPETIAADFHTERLYTTGVITGGEAAFRIISMTDFSIIDQVMVSDHFLYGRPLVSPSGDLVFLRGIGSAGEDHQIRKYDPHTKSLVNYLDESHFLSPLFQPWNMAVTPDDKILCVNVSPSTQESGAVILFDIRSRNVLTVFGFDYGWGRADYVRIYPISR